MVFEGLNEDDVILGKYRGFGNVQGKDGILTAAFKRVGRERACKKDQRERTIEVRWEGVAGQQAHMLRWDK